MKWRVGIVAAAWLSLATRAEAQGSYQRGEITFSVGGRELRWVIVTEELTPGVPVGSSFFLDDNKHLISAGVLYTPDGKIAEAPDPVVGLGLMWNGLDRVFELDGFSISYGRFSVSYRPRETGSRAKCTLRLSAAANGAIAGSGTCTGGEPDQARVTKFTFSASP